MDRRDILCAGAGLAALPGSAFAQTRSQALEAHTRFLAHDLLEGRDAGTRGYDIAAAYLAAQFQAAGLAPGTVDGWFQPLIVRRRTLLSADIAYVNGDQRNALVNGQDVAIDASPRLTEETLDLELVFVGWGIDAPAMGVQSYDGLDVAGKAVVLLEGAPASWPGAVRAHYSWIQQKARMATARGAAAMFTVKTPARERVFSWDQARVLRLRPAVTWLGERPPGEAPPQANMILSPAFARSLVAAAGKDIDAIFQQSETGPVESFALPGRMRIARRSQHEDAASANVIGKLNGRDPRVAHEHFIVIGHLDHLGIGPEVNGDRIYNGAVDNAGGIAVMLEAARSLTARRAPKRSVLFIASTGEERGLIGSEYYMTRPSVPVEAMVGALSVDGLMAFHDFGGIVALGAEHSTLGEISLDAARRVGARHVPDPDPARGNLALSDQYPFLRRGVPVLFPNPARGMARSGPDNLELWDAYEERAYHQPSDDINLPLNWEAAARWTDYIEYVIAGAANAAHRPLWYEDDALAGVFSPRGARARRP